MNHKEAETVSRSESSAVVSPGLWLWRPHGNVRYTQIFRSVSKYQVHVAGPRRDFKKQDSVS